MKKIRMAFFALAAFALLATSTGCGGGGGGSDDDDTPVAESGSTGGSGAESGASTGSGTGSGSSESGSGNTSSGTGNESTGGSGSGSGSASQVTVSQATTTVTILPYTNSAIADKVFYRTKEDGKIKYHLFNGGKCYESSNSDYFSNEDDDHPIIISWNGNVYRLDPDKINLRINGSGLFSTFQHGDGGDDAIMTFNSNGSGTIDVDGKNIPLTFTNNAGVLTLSFTYEGKPATALFAYDGTKLYAIDDDLRLIFVKNYDSGSGSGSSSEVTVSEATTTVTILPYTNSAIADKVFYRTKENGKTKYYLFNGGKCYESSNSDYFSNEDDDHSTIISWNGNIYLSGTAKINSRISGSGLFASFQQGAGGDNAIMTFNSNGSGSISVDGETIPFTFTNNAGVLTISYTYQGNPDTMLFAYDGTKLYNIDEDIHLIFVKNYSSSQESVSQATTTVTTLPYTDSTIAGKVFYRTKDDGKKKYHLFNGGKCYESSSSDYFSNEDDDHPTIISRNGNVYRLDQTKIYSRTSGTGLFASFRQGAGGDNVIMTFNSNGSGTISVDGETIPFTFTNNAGVLTVSYTYEGTSDTMLFAYNGTKLYAIDDELRLIFVKNYSSSSGSGSTTSSIPAGFVAVPRATFDGTTAITGSSVFIANRTVTIPSLLVCDHEVTQAEYKSVMGNNPSYFSSGPASGETQANRPVEAVSWYYALVYCNTRSMADGRTPCYKINGKTNPSEWGAVPTSSNSTWNAATCDFAANGYRLPTEAEWEYLARGGNLTNIGQTPYSGSNSIGDVAWWTFNSGDKTHEVKKKAKNALNLYDMSGNVWELCWDWYGSISTSTPSAGAASGSYRVSRGGSWRYNTTYCSVSSRDYYFPSDRVNNYGFRVVCSRSE